MVISKDKARIQAIIPEEIFKKLKDQAEYEGRSISNMASKILKDYYGYSEEAEEY